MVSATGWMEVGTRWRPPMTVCIGRVWENVERADVRTFDIPA